MEFDDFVSALQAAGWTAYHDAQHTKIRKLWEQMFPVVAKLSDELEELKDELGGLRRELK